MELDECMRCCTTRALRGNVVFYVTKCVHLLCSGCKDEICEERPNNVVCPIDGCGYMQREFDIRPKIYEDLFVDADVKVRRRIMSIFNKGRNAFKSQQEYDDYLEDREDLIQELCVPSMQREQEAEAKIKKYLAENSAEQIKRHNHETNTRLQQERLALQRAVQQRLDRANNVVDESPPERANLDEQVWGDTLAHTADDNPLYTYATQSLQSHLGPCVPTEAELVEYLQYQPDAAGQPQQYADFRVFGFSRVDACNKMFIAASDSLFA